MQHLDAKKSQFSILLHSCDRCALALGGPGVKIAGSDGRRGCRGCTGAILPPGAVWERQLARGESLNVDTGCLVAMEPSVSFDLEQVGGVKSALFGGEGLFFAHLRGPGRIWIQSLPFSRLAGRMLAAAPATGGRRVGEGSILGGLGGLLDGDNR